MRPLTSSVLDFMRISAAVGVVISHMATARFAHSVPTLESMGHACVAVFFVLSGYVIAWVTDKRESGPRRYAVARLARIYSVLVPALLVTAVLDYASTRLDPTFYASIVGHGGADPLNYVRSMLFLNQSYGQDYHPGSNSPVWSLGYEVPYYAMFAVALFARGAWKLAGMAILLVLVGPAVWMLFPVWLMGVALYALIGRRPPAPRTAAVAGAVIVGLAAAAPLLMRLQKSLYVVETDYASVVSFGYSNQIVIFYAIGLLVCCLIALVDVGSATFGDRLPRLRKTIAYIAGSTFSIYLFHYPVLVFIGSLTRYDRLDTVSVLSVFVVTIVACVLLSYVSERQKRVWTRLLSRVIGRPAGTTTGTTAGATAGSTKDALT